MKNRTQHPYVTFGIPLKSLSFTSCSSIADLIEFLQQAGKHIYVIGGGSNILPIAYINADLVRADIKGIAYEDAGDCIYVTAGSGVEWHELVLDTLDKGYSGLENLSLIPGLVGAAPIQNIGAYGVELQDRLEGVEILDIQTQETYILGNEDCEFAYRDSIFKRELKGRGIITRVTLRLDKEPNLNLSYGALLSEVEEMTDTPTAKIVSNAVIKIRQSKLPDPKRIGNAGSFFKNPLVDVDIHSKLKHDFPNLIAYQQENGYKLAAGWLVDQCGLKGYRKGDAGVHVDQALVLVNYGEARGEEILAVASLVQREVFDKFKVNLQPEVQIIGDKELIERSGLQLA